MDKWMKSVLFLALIIVLSSAGIRLLTRGETLSNYADQNPEIAYATPKVTASPVPASDGAPSSSAAVSDVASEDFSDVDSEDFSDVDSEFLSGEAVPSPAPDLFVPVTVESSESTHYEEGFFYQPLTDDVIARITGISYPVSETIAPALAVSATNIVSDEAAGSLAVSYDDLRYLGIKYYDFNGEVQVGELICNKGIAQDLVEIFYELYLNEYQIEKVRLIDEYNGDDTASMLDNNTSCFNYRVVDGTSSLSKHAIGCAIDINPFYNPYVVFNKDGSGETYISPKGSEIYADRSQNFPYKIDENDLCYQLFKEHGFTWGGNWNSCKDYQHFQKAAG